MSPNEYFWWIGAGALIVAELLTGTFYLLMIALGFVAGAVSRLAGADVGLQFVCAALVALAAVVALRRSKLGRRRQRPDAASNPDINPDIGATLEVSGWQNGRARVPYRGAQWDVELAPGERADARVYEVVAVRGNCLVLAAKRPVSTHKPHHPLTTTKE